MLLNFCVSFLFICLLLQGKSQPRTQNSKEKKKLFSSQHNSILFCRIVIGVLKSIFKLVLLFCSQHPFLVQSFKLYSQINYSDNFITVLIILIRCNVSNAYQVPSAIMVDILKTKKKLTCPHRATIYVVFTCFLFAHLISIFYSTL